MTSNLAVKYQVLAAARACEEKKAQQLAILQMDKKSGVFTDYFVICSGTNPRQNQAIADEVRDRLHIADMTPAHTEGYNQAEWILLDYVDFVVHIFSEKARSFYDLERLWKSARRLAPSEILAAEKKKTKEPVVGKSAARAAPKKGKTAGRASSKHSILAAGRRSSAARKTTARRKKK